MTDVVERNKPSCRDRAGSSRWAFLRAWANRGGRRRTTRGVKSERIAAIGQQSERKGAGQYEMFANRVKTVLNVTKVQHGRGARFQRARHDGIVPHLFLRQS